jgi:hypothetical protein
MNTTPDSLREKTDIELVEMIRQLAQRMHTIGQEQKRRIEMASHAARDAEESEGGLSTPERSG